MPVPSTIADLSTTAASNSPAGSDSIGTSLDDYLRSIQSILKQSLSQGTDITAAATITPLADGSYFTVNGSTGITGIGSANSWNGRKIVLRFASNPTITHNGASLILPGSANINTTAGDVAAFVQESSGVWRCTEYLKADGTNLNGVDVQTHAATSKTTPVDADEIPLSDSAASWGLKKLTWGNLKAALPAPVPSGAVIFVANNTAPSGYLKANGAAVSRTTYAALFTAIGTTFGVGDGSTTFNVPDLRAEFIRGWDDSRGVDSGRAFGSAQTDALQGHYHGATLGNTGAAGGGSSPTVGPTTGGFGNTQFASGLVTDGTNGTPRSAAETRPRNVALLACIKY